MSAGSSPRLGTDRRLAALGSALRRKSSRRGSDLIRLVGEELSPNPRRIRLAVRIGLECAVGMSLMAAMQIDNILGAYVLYNLTSAGAPMLRPMTAFLLILAEGAALALSHPLAGILAEAPWLMLSFFALETATYAYLVSRLQLGAVWLMVQITYLGTFYIVVFAPNDYGWGVAYTFGGVTVAFLLMTLFDTVLWPEPAEAALLESLQANLERTRTRLRQRRPSLSCSRRGRTPSGRAADFEPACSSESAQPRRVGTFRPASRRGPARLRYNHRAHLRGTLTTDLRRRRKCAGSFPRVVQATARGRGRCARSFDGSA